jgi:ABC-type branched-subunit amino acid transport system substrate-binding protein
MGAEVVGGSVSAVGKRHFQEIAAQIVVANPDCLLNTVSGDGNAMAGDYAACCYFQTVDAEENQRFVAAFRKKFGPRRGVTDPMEAAYEREALGRSR